MKINGKEIKAKQFAYDGCHKIYLIEDTDDLKDAKDIGYDIYDIKLLKETYDGSCSLRFINNWKLTEQIVPQFETAKFEE